jgi:hypothetical protein
VVSAWTTGGNVPDAIVRLQATPASAAAKFSFGCGSNDGTASCDLGAMDAKSAQRQLQAESTVPVTASAVTSVQLTVIGSAASLPKDPMASATVPISGSVTPITTTSPLPIGSLPGVGVPGVGVPEAGVTTTSPTLSPGGNAAGLFPTLKPSSSPSASKDAKARPVADTSALPGGAPVVGASLVGLAALVLAFVLAVTRLSIRRRPAAAASAAAAAPPGTETHEPAADAAATETADPEPSDASPATPQDPADLPDDGHPDA